MKEDVKILTLADCKLAYQQRVSSERESSKPDLFFLGGFASDMMGSKALFLDEQTKQQGIGFTRFDYQGHGQSSGCFVDGTIGSWLEDSLAVFDHTTVGPQILIGSSMGGWIAMRLMQFRPERVVGFVGVAAAPDFTEDLIVPFLSEDQKKSLAEEGVIPDPDAHSGQARPITAKLLKEAQCQLTLRAPLFFNGPVSLLHGRLDTDVPWRHALKIMETITTLDLRLILIKDGEHRMSRPQDLTLLWREIVEMREKLKKCP